MIALVAKPSHAEWATVAAEWGDYRFGEKEIDWFKAARSKRSGTVSCCDMADGHRTTWSRHPDDDRYWTVILGKEYPVPPEAIVTTPSPVDEPIVWYRLDNGEPWIRCFSPGNGA